MAKKIMTTDFGAPVTEDISSQTAGQHGPMLLQDVHFLEKLSHFDRERIPERVVHAKGAGAYGWFEATEDVSRYTCADFLSKGTKTEMFARFSTVAGEAGSADAERDPRGFALKFYTRQGNYDLVGNNTPIFFIRDPLKFPDFIHSQKRLPADNLKSAKAAWDFWSLTPEALHQIVILMSDRGVPSTFRHMHGFGSHTYMWYNKKGEYFWVKYHFLTEQGIQCLHLKEANEMRGKDPDHATRDLYEAIGRKEFPAWKAYVQILTPDEARKLPFDPFDLTKIWPHGIAPLRPLGRFVLDRAPENYFAEVEQAAFNPSNFVPGIGPSPDKMLQGRLFSYHDTHLHRLGANYHLIPVNQAKNAPVQNNQVAGPMRTDKNHGSAPNYWPNSLNGAAPDPEMPAMPRVSLEGYAGSHPYELTDADFEQPRALYEKVMDEKHRGYLIENIVDHMGSVPTYIKLRSVALFYKMSPDCGARLAKGLKLDEAEVKKLAAMSQDERLKATAPK